MGFSVFCVWWDLLTTSFKVDFPINITSLLLEFLTNQITFSPKPRLLPSLFHLHQLHVLHHFSVVQDTVNWSVRCCDLRGHFLSDQTSACVWAAAESHMFWASSCVGDNQLWRDFLPRMKMLLLSKNSYTHTHTLGPNRAHRLVLREVQCCGWMILSLFNHFESLNFDLVWFQCKTFVPCLWCEQQGGLPASHCLSGLQHRAGWFWQWCKF